MRKGNVRTIFDKTYLILLSVVATQASEKLLIKPQKSATNYL